MKLNHLSVVSGVGHGEAWGWRAGGWARGPFQPKGSRAVLTRGLDVREVGNAVLSDCSQRINVLRKSAAVLF